MDLSEFKPPVRLSMSDEEIYQALGQAQATEDGLAKAMAIVEEQATLREHDNQLFSEWVTRMQNSDAPQAKIALENIERVKQGLEPLPLDSVTQVAEDDIAASLNAAYQPAAMEPTPELVLEDQTELGVDEFDALLIEAAGEATSSILVAAEVAPVEVPEAAVVVEVQPPAQEPVEVLDFEISADEDALVEEEKVRDVQKVEKTSKDWWSTASFWTIASVLLSVVGAYLVSLQKVSLGTALVGFGIGLLFNLGVVVAGYVTARRSSVSAEITTRATYGVFGAFVAGLFTLKVRLIALGLVALGAVISFDGAFKTEMSFHSQIINGISVQTALIAGVLLVAFVLAAFVKRSFRWINLSAALVGLAGFVAAGLLTRDAIDFSTLAFGIDWAAVGVIAGVVAVATVALNGAEQQEALGQQSSGKPLLRWVSTSFATFAVPMAVFAHFFLVFASFKPQSGFGILDVFVQQLDPAFATAVLWVVVALVVVLAANLAKASLAALGLFAINSIKWWMAAPVFVVLVAMIYVFADWAFWVDAAALVVPLAAIGVGFSLSETLIRRGEFHEASLLRSYGFYGPVNYFAVSGYLVLAVGALSITPASATFGWLGFAGWTTPYSTVIALFAGLVWNTATAIPRVLVQQREVSEVELRKASLNEFSGFTE